MYSQGVFGMNITLLEPTEAAGTLWQYLATAIPFTVTTIWIVVAFQVHHFYPNLGTFRTRLRWPITLPQHYFNQRRETRRPITQNQDIRLNRREPA
jgi:hypothetical protein